MGVTIEDIKKLKELTGVGLTDAKVALVEAEGDFDKAIAHIQEFTAQRSVHKMNPIPVYSGLIYYFGGKMNDPRAAHYFAEADKETAV